MIIPTTLFLIYFEELEFFQLLEKIQGQSEVQRLTLHCNDKNSGDERSTALR